MTINTSQQAIDKALAQTRNAVGTCQMTVRTWFNAPSAGDVDHDGDSDAKDGWLSEPVKARHPGDRNPPPGVPLYFSKDGGRGFGHRAMTLAHDGRIRSTDMLDNHYSGGSTSTVVAPTNSEALAVLERAMGIQYVGWSETIDGNLIPNFAPKPVVEKPKPAPKPPTRGPRVDEAIKDVAHAHAKPGSEREGLLARALKTLRKIPFRNQKS